MRPKAESTIALLLNLFFCIPNPEPSSEIMTDNEEEAPSSYEARLSRLRHHHKLPEFKQLRLLGKDVGKEL